MMMVIKIDQIIGGDRGIALEYLVLDAYSGTPNPETDIGLIYSKTVEGQTELYFFDDASNEIQLTKDGYLNTDEGSPNITLLEQSTNPTYGDDYGKVYSKEADGYTDLFYIDNYGNTIQLSNGGELGVIGSGDMVVQNGFSNQTDSDITFTDGTRTLEISPSGSEFVFWSGGTKFTKTSADNVIIDNVGGTHYVYYNYNGELKSTTSFVSDIIEDYAYVAFVYWDATNSKGIMVGDERHGRIMDSETHTWAHNSFGTRYNAGLALGNITTEGTGNNNADAYCSVSDGSIRDEDVVHNIADGDPQTLSPISEIPMFYRSGSGGDWRRIDATNYPVTTTGSGRAAWNENSGGTWSLTEIANSRFVLSHIFATGDVEHPIIGIIGQAEYTTVAGARVGAADEINELSLGDLGSLSPEFKAIATLIYQTNDTYTNPVKSRIRETDTGDDYIDFRFSAAGGSGTGGTTDDHSSLANLGNDDHTQYYNEARGDARYALLTDFNTHTGDTTNPHQTTLDLAYTQGSIVTIDSGPIVLDGSGSSVLDLDGYLSFDEQSGDPTATGNQGHLYTKDASGITELFYIDSAGNVTQVTTGGSPAGVNSVDVIAQVAQGTDVGNTTGTMTGDVDLRGAVNQINFNRDSSNQATIGLAETIEIEVLASRNNTSNLIDLDTGSNGIQIASDAEFDLNITGNTTLDTTDFIITSAGGVTVDASGAEALGLDGYAKFIEVSTPSPIGNAGLVYTKDDGGDTELFYMDDSGDEIQLTQDGYLATFELGVPGVGMFEQSSDPTNVEDKGFIYTKDVNGVTEMFYIDSDGNTTQMTNGGSPAGVNSIEVIAQAAQGSDVGNTTGELSGDVDLRGAVNQINFNRDSATQGTIGLAETIEVEAIASRNNTSNLIDLDTASNGIQINSDAEVDINSISFDLDAFGAINIDGYAISVDGTDTMNFTMTSDDAGDKDFTIQAINNGAGDGNLLLVADEEVDITSSTLDMNLSGATTLDTTSFTVTAAGGLIVDASGANAADLDGYLALKEISEPTALADSGLVYTKDDGTNTELYYKDSYGGEVKITEDGYLAVYDVGVNNNGVPGIGLYEQSSDPGTAEDKSFVYTKDVNGNTELFYKDSDGNVTQITNSGAPIGVNNIEVIAQAAQGTDVGTTLGTLSGDVNLRGAVNQINFNFDSSTQATLGLSETIEVESVASRNNTSNLIDLDTGSNGIQIVSDAEFDVNATGNVTVDGAVHQYTSTDDMYFTMNANSANPKYILFDSNNAGAGASVIRLNAEDKIDLFSDEFDVDIDGAITIDGYGVSIDGTDTMNFTMTANDAASKTLLVRSINNGVGTGNLELRADNAVNTFGASIGIYTDGPMDFNSAVFTLDSSTMSLDSTDTTNLTMTANDAGDKDLTVQAINNGAGAGNLLLAADEEVDITSSTLDINLSGAATFDTTELTITAAGGAKIDASGAEALELDGYLRLDEVSSPSALENAGMVYTKDDSADTEFFYMDDSGNEVQITRDGYLAIDLGVPSLALYEQAGDPTTTDDKGHVYTKDVSGNTEMFYKDSSGNVVQLTDGGSVIAGTAYDDTLNSTGAQTTLVLSTNPTAAANKESGFDLDVYRNGVLLDYVSSLGSNKSEWTYNDGTKTVSFVASGTNDKYRAQYRA